MSKLNFIFILIFTISLVGCGDKEAKPTQSAVEKPEAANPNTNPKNLIGSWMRTDGNYTIKIDKVKDQGYLSAGYFNPQPIHTDKTTYKIENNQIKIHMLLDDKSYPKCTYDLVYDDSKQMLFGQYYQATSGQTYNVMFQKI